ncbi:MAG: hypothetical protein K6F91_07940 [Ruminococcus sp.]|nr:hypothetical protein [Ruminococcus sp.]
MPAFEETTEFAVKWSSLYDSFMQEGIRDAIIVYEYMNNYYVQEGNKRVLNHPSGTRIINGFERNLLEIDENEKADLTKREIITRLIGAFCDTAGLYIYDKKAAWVKRSRSLCHAAL